MGDDGNMADSYASDKAAQQDFDDEMAAEGHMAMMSEMGDFIQGTYDAIDDKYKPDKDEFNDYMYDEYNISMASEHVSQFCEG
jgi:hypothetical protein